MNSSDPSLLLMIEAAAPFFILSIVLAFALMSGRKKMKSAAKQLILDVKGSEKADRDSVKKYLKQTLKLDKKQVKKATKKILNERKFLLRNIISGILDKNLEAISLLNQDLNRVCKQYHELEVVAIETVDEVVEETPSVEDESNLEKNKALKKEIKNLKQEVHITLTTLNNIFKEFSSMFGENVPDNDMSVEQIITAMESFSNKEATSLPDDIQAESSLEIDSNSVEEEVEDKTKEAEDNVEGENISSILDEDITDDVEESIEDEEISVEETLAEDASISEQLDNILGDDGEIDNLDFSGADEVDDIDGALDMLELDSTDEEEGEPDWGDAFAESGDVMEDDKEA